MTSYDRAWWISLFIKLIISLTSLVPLSADEAYYWVWTQFPQWSYYDHPPFVSWLMHLGSALPESLLRWPSLLLFHFAFLFWFNILRPHFSEKQIFFWFLICQFCPLLGLGSIIVTPDAPLFFFFSLSLFSFVRALKSQNLKDYALFGLSLGLGFLSKYTIVIAAGLFIFYLIRQKNWIHFKAKPLVAVLGLGILGSLPVIIWNWQNHFRSFSFQLNHGFNETQWDWTWPIAYLLGTYFLAGPINVRRAFRGLDSNKLFKVLVLGGFGFFLISSFRAPVELNWPAVFYPALFALSIAGFKNHDIKQNLFYWVFIYTLLIVGATTGINPALQEKINEPFRAKSWAHLPFQYETLYASTYQLASLLWWNAGKPVYKLSGSSRHDLFDEVQSSKPQVKTFYLLKENGNNLPDWLQTANWEKEEVQILDHRHVVMKLTNRDAP